MRAHKLLENKKDYVISPDGEVELFDGATGRLMHGVKLRGGQHQAIEAKEKVEISQEYRTVASVTFQNLFMLFDKIICKTSKGFIDKGGAEPEMTGSVE